MVAQVVTKSGSGSHSGLAAWKTPKQWCGLNSFYSVTGVGQVSCAPAQASSLIPGQTGACSGPVPGSFRYFRANLHHVAIRCACSVGHLARERERLLGGAGDFPPSRYAERTAQHAGRAARYTAPPGCKHNSSPRDLSKGLGQGRSRQKCKANLQSYKT